MSAIEWWENLGKGWARSKTKVGASYAAACFDIAAALREGRPTEHIRPLFMGLSAPESFLK
jgi:hypothetical protein